LVAKDFSQVEGIDFDELFSPVVKYESTRLIFSLVVIYDWDMLGLDVKATYIYVKLDEEIYMEMPEACDLASVPPGSVDVNGGLNCPL
jgi:hypothetical protein